MIREAIEKLVKNEDLTEEEANQTMKEIMEGIATPAQISSFITATRMKGETAEEITGCAKLMREKVSRIKTKHKIIMSEPPESTIMPWEMGRFPIDISKEKPDFLPLPDYGYSDPLEKIFLGLPFRFLKKV